LDIRSFAATRNIVQNEILTSVATASTTYVSGGSANGMSVTITPGTTGRVKITCVVMAQSSATADGFSVDIFQIAGSSSNVPSAGSSAFSGSPLGVPFSMTTVPTASLPIYGTIVWLDTTTGFGQRSYYLGIKAITAGTASAGLLVAGGFANWLAEEV
jgi:hypothetical protein